MRACLYVCVCVCVCAVCLDSYAEGLLMQALQILPASVSSLFICVRWPLAGTVLLIVYRISVCACGCVSISLCTLINLFVCSYICPSCYHPVSLSLSLSLSDCLLHICVRVWLCVYLSLCTLIYLFVHISVHLVITTSVCLSVCLSVSLLIELYLCRFPPSLPSRSAPRPP